MTMHTRRLFDAAALLAAALLITLVLVGFVRAEESRTFRNEKGQEIGRSITRGNTTVHKDAMGREIGRSERRGDGTTNYYDALGRSLGSSRERR
jgi:hypothetical protein